MEHFEGILLHHCEISSDTRLESKIESIKSLWFKTKGIYRVLISIRSASNGKDSKAYWDAKPLGAEIAFFLFLLCLVICNDLLIDINKVSRLLQHENIQIDVGQELISSIQSLLSRKLHMFSHQQSTLQPDYVDSWRYWRKGDIVCRTIWIWKWRGLSRWCLVKFTFYSMQSMLFLSPLATALICWANASLFSLITPHYWNIRNIRSDWSTVKFFHCTNNTYRWWWCCYDRTSGRVSFTFAFSECKKVCDVVDYIQKSGFMEIFPDVLVVLRIIFQFLWVLQAENAVSTN